MGLFRRKTRVRIRPAGVTLVILFVLTFLAAVNTNTNLLYMLAGIQLSLIVISLVSARMNLRGLALTRQSPRASFREQSFHTTVRIENKRWIAPAIGLRVEHAGDTAHVTGFVVRLPAQRAAVLTVKEHFARRGVYRLPDLELVSAFPLGLIERRRRFTDDVEVIVYPRVSAIRPTTLEKSQGAQYMSHTIAPDGDEFFGLREYVRGDDMRHIAWRLSARLGTWMIREMARENARCVVVAIDTRDAPAVEGFAELLEESIDLAASLAISLLRRQYDVGLVTPDAELGWDSGTAQEKRVLEFLARAETLDASSHPEFETGFRRLEAEGALVLPIVPDPERWGRRAGPNALRVIDPREVVHA